MPISHNYEVWLLKVFQCLFVIKTLRLFVVGPWSNGYQCGMQILRPGFNSQRVPDHGCCSWDKLANLNHSLNGGFLLD